MAMYSIELRELLDDPHFTLFNYRDFYIEDDKDMQEDFERRFKEMYYFHEIGFESVARFKHQLNVQLNHLMPLYRKKYATELEAMKCNFMLNKDLKETFLREVDNEMLSKTNATNTNSTSQNSKSDGSSKGSNKRNESRLDNGVANVSLNNRLTASSSDDSSASDTTTSSNTVSSDTSSDSNNEQQQKQIEKTELIAQGNIGTTSSMTLWLEWRENVWDLTARLLEESSIKECFMQIY